MIKVYLISSINFPVIANEVEQLQGALELSNPQIISSTKTEDGKVLLSLFKFPPLSSTSTNRIFISANNIITSYAPDEQLLAEYERIVSQTNQSSSDTTKE
ncbi:MAG: hypothetical protein QXP36_02040 [Conexivisphaerales archaeon]